MDTKLSISVVPQTVRAESVKDSSEWITYSSPSFDLSGLYEFYDLVKSSYRVTLSLLLLVLPLLSHSFENASMFTWHNYSSILILPALQMVVFLDSRYKIRLNRVALELGILMDFPNPHWKILYGAPLGILLAFAFLLFSISRERSDVGSFEDLLLYYGAIVFFLAEDVYRRLNFEQTLLSMQKVLEKKQINTALFAGDLMVVNEVNFLNSILAIGGYNFSKTGSDSSSDLKAWRKKHAKSSIRITRQALREGLTMLQESELLGVDSLQFKDAFSFLEKIQVLNLFIFQKVVVDEDLPFIAECGVNSVKVTLDHSKRGKASRQRHSRGTSA